MIFLGKGHFSRKGSKFCLASLQNCKEAILFRKTKQLSLIFLTMLLNCWEGGSGLEDCSFLVSADCGIYQLSLNALKASFLLSFFRHYNALIVSFFGSNRLALCCAPNHVLQRKWVVLKNTLDSFLSSSKIRIETLGCTCPFTRTTLDYNEQ
jgi:hypothetical protein